MRRVAALRTLSEINDKKMVEWMENTASWWAGRGRERAGAEGGDMVVTARWLATMAMTVGAVELLPGEDSHIYSGRSF